LSVYAGDRRTMRPTFSFRELTEAEATRLIDSLEAERRHDPRLMFELAAEAKAQRRTLWVPTTRFRRCRVGGLRIVG
jgi:hypothetical protein